MGSRVHRVVAAVIERDGKYLITQRRDEAVLPRLWEFPGGRVHDQEDDEAALRREVRERLGVDIVVEEKLTDREHEYESYDVHLSLYACHLPEGQEPRPLRVRDVRWVASSELGSFAFPPADQKTMDQLLLEEDA
ncbi:MAG: (deoxy)nucleoside triphosphate pyrophosphohydrolase [Deltaproteobacteria bacterium]|nr:(deoxy)nucleoside triphosphate pyrophosphohydrolase [Deltaproteobacteria bacterium]